MVDLAHRKHHLKYIVQKQNAICTTMQIAVFFCIRAKKYTSSKAIFIRQSIAFDPNGIIATITLYSITVRWSNSNGQ